MAELGQRLVSYLALVRASCHYAPVSRGEGGAAILDRTRNPFHGTNDTQAWPRMAGCRDARWPKAVWGSAQRATLPAPRQRVAVFLSSLRRENSGHRERRTRTRAYMEASAIAAGGADFLRARKCGDRRSCRKRHDSGERFEGSR